MTLMPSPHQRVLNLIETGQHPTAPQLAAAYGGGRRGRRCVFEGLRALEKMGLIARRDGRIMRTDPIDTSVGMCQNKHNDADGPGQDGET